MFFWSPSTSDIFFLSWTGQACLTQVDTPKRGKSHACTKTHTARIKNKINKSFIIFLPFSIAGEAAQPASPFFA